MTEHKTPILIVNDNPHALLAMEAVVDNPRTRVIRAASGEDALRVLLRQDVAVILLDVKMPGMNGFQTAELIRQRQRSAATPIIFVTAAQIGEHDLFKGYDLGAVDYLVAPIAAHVLRSKVAVFVELFQQRLELEQHIAAQRALEQERALQAKHNQELSRRLIAVQENERRRLSGELHDCTSPNLAAIQINLRMLALESAKICSEQCGHCEDKLEDTQALVQDTVTGLRQICADLRPPALDYAGFWSALDGYARQFSMRTGIAVQIERSGPDKPLSSDVDSVLFRIAQEALTNCAKHACADTVRIQFTAGTDGLILTIADNGIGFNPEDLGSSTPGLGLLTLRERAQFAGGSASILSQPGKGTRIEVSMPLVFSEVANNSSPTMEGTQSC